MFDVITIGTATRDVFLQSPFFKVVHDPQHLRRLGFPAGDAQCFALGAKIQIGPPVLTVGGGAANASVTFARQGLRTGTLVGIGADPNGLAALRDLEEEKVKTFPVYDPKHMTGYSVILLSPNGERTILHYRGASTDVKGTEPIIRRGRAKWIYVSPGGIPLPAMEKITAHFIRHGAKVAMNPSNEYLKLGAKRLKPLLASLNVIISNREEAASLTGVSYKDERGIFKKFDQIVKGIAVMTDGPRGVMVSDGKNIYQAGIFKEKKIADRTGAGDAFGSGFVSALARSGQSGSAYSPASIKEAIRAASANATSVVEKIGAQAGVLRRGELRASRWSGLKVKTTKL